MFFNGFVFLHNNKNNNNKGTSRLIPRFSADKSACGPLIGVLYDPKQTYPNGVLQVPEARSRVRTEEVRSQRRRALLKPDGRLSQQQEGAAGAAEL